MHRHTSSERLSAVARQLRLQKLRNRERARTAEHERSMLIAEALHTAAVETVFDIHPHSCEVGLLLRQCGYRGRIITFEPLLHLWEQLRTCTLSDEDWSVSRSAISISDDIIVGEEGNPQSVTVATRLKGALEVFCDEAEVVAVWISQPQDSLLLPDVLAAQQVRVLSLACTITEAGEDPASLEAVLSTLRQSQWEILGVHSRPHQSADAPSIIVDLLALRKKQR